MTNSTTMAATTIVAPVTLLLERGGAVAEEQTDLGGTLLELEEHPLVIEAVARDGQPLRVRSHVPLANTKVSVTWSNAVHHKPIPFPVDDELEVSPHFYLHLLGGDWRNLQGAFYIPGADSMASVAVCGDVDLAAILAELVGVEDGCGLRLSVAAPRACPLIVDRCWG